MPIKVSSGTGSELSVFDNTSRTEGDQLKGRMETLIRDIIFNHMFFERLRTMHHSKVDELAHLDDGIDLSRVNLTEETLPQDTLRYAAYRYRIVRLELNLLY